MATKIHQAILLSCRTPLTHFQRFRGKINIQRPRQPHYDRALVLAVTQPIYKEEPKTRDCFLPKQREQIHNPLNDIIAREALNWLNQSKMVGIFHMNSINSDDLFNIRVALHKQNMHLKTYSKKIITKAVENSRFENIMPLIDSNHCLVFSNEPHVAQMIRTTRRVPQMLLMAGIVENRLLSRNELVKYSKLPSLQMAQSELVHTLNMSTTQLVQNLEAHQNQFVQVLDVYAKSQENKVTPNADEKSENVKNEAIIENKS